MAVRQQGEDMLVFDTPTKQVVSMSRILPGRRRWKDGKLFVQASADNLRIIIQELPGITEVGLPVLDLYLGAQGELAAIRDSKKTELPLEASAYPFKTTPFDHQRRAFALSRDLRDFAYFMEMGTGKTKVNIDIAGYLYLAGHIDVLVVLAPNGVHRQWVDSEIPTHMSDEVWYAAFAYPPKLRKSDSKRLDFVRSAKGLRIFTFSIQSLSSNRFVQQELENLTIQYGKRAMIVVDESHMFKDPTANRSKFVQGLTASYAYRRINTGSPIDGDIESLYGQLILMNKGIVGHASFTSFKREFCIMEQIYGAPRGAMKVVGYKNIKRLVEILDGCSIRVMKDDCLDLPEKLYSKVYVEWDPEQKRIYRDIKKNLAAMIQGHEVTAPLALTAMTKLRQVLGGSIFSDKGESLDIPTKKLEALRNIAEQNPRGGVVWVQYLSEARRVARELESMGKRVGLYIGETSDDERRRITTEGEVDWLVANDAASTGLNLAWWDLAVYYSNSFNAIIRWQSEDRIHRIGQKNRPRYIDLVVPGTVDDVVSDALARKRMRADYVWQPEEFVKDVLSLSDDSED